MAVGAIAPDAKACSPVAAMLPVETLSTLPPAAIAGIVCEAAAAGDITRMRSLAQGGINVDVSTPYDRRTPLHLAAASGNLAMVKFLTEECGITLQQDRFGLLPIHDAVQNGHIEVRRYLQGRKLQANEEVPAGRPRSLSCEMEHHQPARQQPVEEIMNTVFELIVKEGVFSYTTVHAEVQHFFKALNLHPIYFEQFTSLQIAKHVHCLIAAKRVARATDDTNRMDFAFKTDISGFFLTTIACPVPTEAQIRTEDKVAKYLEDESRVGKNNSISLTFMASEGPAFKGGIERLGIFSAEQNRFDTVRVPEGETSIEVLASAKFLKEKTVAAKEQYQIIMEDVVAMRRGVVRIVPGSAYPGPYPGGFVLLFGTAEAAGSCFFREMCSAMRFEGLSPKRFYLETFANGVLTYSIFFPSAKEADVQRLKRTILHSTLLKAFPGKSERIYSSVMQAKITHQVGLYLLAAVKFAYAFFPKEQYAREYTTVHKVLEQDPASQRKLEALYKLCMKELLSTERIYELVQRHLDLGVRLFEDFRRIALGEAPPAANAELGRAIDAACAEPQDRQILRMMLTFNASMLLTNFFKSETPGAFAFRLDPAVVLKDRPSYLYPAMPYAIYLVQGRDFFGFHVRFRDVARGGIRLVLSRDMETYERNQSTLFDECYNLSLTQQYKNKDIPEGGAKGVILPDSSWPSTGGNVLAGNSSQSPAAQRSCFIRYLNALLDCMMPAQSGIYVGHMQGHEELLFFGPDENTAGFMDLGAELGRVRGYPYWKALTTGKSVKLGGVPHDTYGMTTASVHTYVLELLRELGEDEASITKFQTGGPDGDLGSNEILVSKDKTIAVVDGSGVLYDPAGLDRAELVRLATRRVPVREFSRSFLGPKGFLVTVDEADVALPDGSSWRTGAELRDKFHLTAYATADLFVPCGGRPNSVSTENVKSFFIGERPKFRMVVEGANLFFSDGARAALERAGVHVFKDASTNKGGVTSSSLEVFAALALPPEEHRELMTYSPEDGGAPPSFYEEYVRQILATIRENANQEFRTIWACNREEGIHKVDLTRRLSSKINQMQDSIQNNFAAVMSEEERGQLVRVVLTQAVPPLLIERIGVDGIISRVPPNYIGAIVGAWVASRFVYRHGLSASEVSFFCFMRSLLAGGDGAAGRAADPSTERELKRKASDAIQSMGLAPKARRG